MNVHSNVALSCTMLTYLGNPPAGTLKAVLGEDGGGFLDRGLDGAETVRAATEGLLPPDMPQGNLVEVLGREVRRGSPGELMVESSPSLQRRSACETNKGNPDEAADAVPLTSYLLTLLLHYSSVGASVSRQNYS